MNSIKAKIRKLSARPLIFTLILVMVVSAACVGLALITFWPHLGAIMMGDGQGRQNAAIVRALTYDAEMSKRRYDSGNKVRYLSELRKIPLGGCPFGFVAAYRKHIAAWRAGDKTAIEETWQNVLLVAYDHGVDCEKYVFLPSSSSSSANGAAAVNDLPSPSSSSANGDAAISALLQILSEAAQQQESSYNQQQQQSGWQVQQQQQRQIEQDILRRAQLNEYYPNAVPDARFP